MVRYDDRSTEVSPSGVVVPNDYLVHAAAWALATTARAESPSSVVDIELPDALDAVVDGIGVPAGHAPPAGARR
jgi:hypothetical protein